VGPVYDLDSGRERLLSRAWFTPEWIMSPLKGRPPAAVAAWHQTAAAEDAGSSFPTTCFVAVALMSLDFDTDRGDRICVDHLMDLLAPSDHHEVKIDGSRI
jgi:hypothetical protein